MSSLMGLIEPERPELFALELKKKKIAIFDFVYSLASTIFIQSALNLAKMYITIGSWMSLIMGLIRFKRLELFTLELEKLLHLTLFTLQHLQSLISWH